MNTRFLHNTRNLLCSYIYAWLIPDKANVKIQIEKNMAIKHLTGKQDRQGTQKMTLSQAQ